MILPAMVIITIPILVQWFYLNQMKGNPDKCCLWLSSSKKVTVNIQDLNIINSKSEKHLGISIKSNLNFQSHVNNLCKNDPNKWIGKIQINDPNKSSKIQINGLAKSIGK